MSWYQRYRKYKQLVKEIVFEQSELDYIETIIEEIKPELAKLERCYLQKNNFNFDDIPASVNIPPTDSTGIIKMKQQPESKIKHFARMYKMIAKKAHPDKLINRPRTEEVIEKEEMFAAATTAYKSSDWAKFLEIAVKLEIRPISLTLLISEIPKETEKLKEKKEKLKQTFGWQLYECGEDEACKEKLIRKVMNQVYNV